MTTHDSNRLLATQELFAAIESYPSCSSDREYALDTLDMLICSADTSWRDIIGYTPLIVAITTEGCLDVVRLFIKRGVELYVTDADELTPLHHAAATGSPEIVKELLAAGAQVNSRDEKQRTPLFHAILSRRDSRSDDSEIVRLLMECGAKLAVKDQCGRSPLDYAIELRFPRSTVEAMKQAAKQEQGKKSQHKSTRKQDGPFDEHVR